jgi:hypothetical protein
VTNVGVRNVTWKSTRRIRDGANGGNTNCPATSQVQYRGVCP